MASERRIGLIGFGTIAKDIQARLGNEGFAFAALLQPDSPSRADVPAGLTLLASVDELLAWRPALVVEAAGHATVSQLLPAILAAGIPAIPASTGALADDDLLARLAEAAERGRTRLIVPSGAVGGLDYLAALGETADAHVCYTSRKPPAAWGPELAALGLAEKAAQAEIVLYEGTARKAAKLYPKNLNVGLTIALAVGHDRLSVRIVSDPWAAGNTHEIEAESALGTARMSFVNLPSPANPKTSALTAASLAAAIRRQFDRIAI
ncbi:putative L-aspartate dehydrogenase 2 [Bosea sp. 62]|uniref:aspartate dehydrogenase n=1 Tax=unclassified Bosea (in: a-proteobacteria) TaxID=2653178 RepID=UPI0012552B89|nr:MULTISPECIES: aspartate dehydrogenase [unclassified Bosea (in: a-proteobacteria)]CAD5256203.1 putative L-aspartate dehydrogenase 2 [Bosea sp. 7B]CAD5274405.1 putative L-aspartate dehydrogenase 2 [Bosea sp. 21B]CAD5275595.1 putative L-aspartate dehydrogenase 2 [Bosea sp. 46]VVT60102.1 putative L-aspartate dehydrogenase 2 [Bosea sp. EC-HK365B]VXB55107.1 putative L-aspartate dehydrogenase 2 [Bosea sp. 62]